MTGNDIPGTMKYLTEVHDKFDDSTPIEYHFLDSQIDLLYKSERQAGKIFLFGACLTIFIACLGLFGLASFMIQRRTKEIGIRKVLGASIGGLYLLVSTSFVKQVLIAWAVAVPLAWLSMRMWLEAFTIKITLGIGVFLLAGGVAIVIALVTISYRAIIVSMTNPANTLRYE